MALKHTLVSVLNAVWNTNKRFSGPEPEGRVNSATIASISLENTIQGRTTRRLASRIGCMSIRGENAVIPKSS